jgi:hypothetical protein
VRGPYVLERPDGSRVAVRYAARANTPWPNSHTSLLVPEGDEADRDDDLDVDSALADAGLVSGYARAGVG